MSEKYNRNAVNQAAFRCSLRFLTTFFRLRLGKRVPSSLPRDFSRFVGGREGEPNTGKSL